MDWHATQTRLGVTADGVAGPVTYAALFREAGCRDSNVAADLGRQAAASFPKYRIDTPRRIAHFLGQGAHETQGYKFLVEVWGPTPAQRRYDTRTDLGNTAAADGDGKRYRGRGIFQITGRRNYDIYGRRIGIDLLANPERAADPAVSVILACEFWTDVGLNAFADANDILAVSRGINTSGPRSRVTPNGLDDRTRRTMLLLKVLGA